MGEPADYDRYRDHVNDYLAGEFPDPKHLEHDQIRGILNAMAAGYDAAHNLDPGSVTALDDRQRQRAVHDHAADAAASYLETTYGRDIEIALTDTGDQLRSYLIRADRAPFTAPLASALRAFIVAYRKAALDEHALTLTGTIDSTVEATDEPPDPDAVRRDQAEAAATAQLRDSEREFIGNYLAAQREGDPDRYEDRLDGLATALATGLTAATQQPPRAMRPDQLQAVAAQVGATYLTTQHHLDINVLHEPWPGPGTIPRTHLVRADHQPLTHDQDRELAALLAAYRHALGMTATLLGDIDTHDPAIYGPAPARSHIVHPTSGLPVTGEDSRAAYLAHCETKYGPGYVTSTAAEVDDLSATTRRFHDGYRFAVQRFYSAYLADLRAYQSDHYRSLINAGLASQASVLLTGETGTEIVAGYTPDAYDHGEGFVVYQVDGHQPLTGEQEILLEDFLAGVRAALDPGGADAVTVRSISEDDENVTRLYTGIDEAAGRPYPEDDADAS